MSFDQATEQVRAAIAAQDLDVLERALQVRAAALARGDQPSISGFEAGERALLDLVTWKRRLAMESARLGQLKTAMEGARSKPHIDCRG